MRDGGASSGGEEGETSTQRSRRKKRELAALEIALPGGRSVRLDTLGSVTDTVTEPRQYAELNGEPIVAFAISRAKSRQNVVQVKAIR